MVLSVCSQKFATHFFLSFSGVDSTGLKRLPSSCSNAATVSGYLCQEGTHTSFEYGRYGNPTTNAAEEKIRSAAHLQAMFLLKAWTKCFIHSLCCLI